jgi:pyruvate dehydrogenase E1 component
VLVQDGGNAAHRGGNTPKRSRAVTVEVEDIDLDIPRRKLVVLCGVRAEDAKPTDEGKGADFKGKTVAVPALGSSQHAYIASMAAYVGVDPRKDVNWVVKNTKGFDCQVEHLSDDQIKGLRRGGHDYTKVYAAYSAAVAHKGQPTVILAKTVKGWTLGPGAEARNMTHQMKKLNTEELRKFRDRLELPIPDRKLADAPYFHPGPNSPEVRYLLERRTALNGCVPKRVVRAKPLPLAGEKVFAEFSQGTAETQLVSTTMVFAKLLRNLIRDPGIGKRVVPIVPDEARTFGMEVLFREIGIYAAFGQKYEPVDSKLVLSYTEREDGQLLEEGITEAGSMASLTAAGTSYATHGEPTIPFYIFYSMFFQRTMDQLWVA